jgi:hypothetical protein
VELGLGFHDSETLCADVEARENMDKTIISAARIRLAQKVFKVILVTFPLIASRCFLCVSKMPRQQSP